MAKTKEEGELEYARLRMGRATISDDAGGADGADSAPGADAPRAPAAAAGTGRRPRRQQGAEGADGTDEDALDDSVSAEDAAAHKLSGNAAYGEKRFGAAAESYALAASSAHAAARDRATYLANLSAARLALGEHKAAVAAASRCLALDGGYRKARERRFAARKALGELHGAAEDARALGMPAADVAALEARAKEKDAKVAAEATEELKKLGNSFLSNFGLSLDNFKAEQDPATGSYSIQMKP